MLKGYDKQVRNLFQRLRKNKNSALYENDSMMNLLIKN